jgi:integrase
MPRQMLMSWEQSKNRWVKMYRGERFTVAASILGGTGKTDTVDAANDWWTEKRAEIDRTNSTEPGSSSAILEVLEKFAGQPITTEADAALAMSSLMIYYDNRPLPQEIKDAFLSPEQQAANESSVNSLLDSIDDKNGEASLKSHFEKWKSIQLAAAKSAARKKMNITMLRYFVDFCGENFPVDAISETTWENYWHDLAKKKDLDEGYRRRILATARNFLEYLVEQGAIQAPRNLHSKLLAFRNIPKKIKPKSVEEIKALLSRVKGQTRLHVLLGLNCGMLPMDISCLTQNMVDWLAGTITRERTKLKNMPDAPTVTYKLWKKTFALLKKYRSAGDLVLTTKSGKPWVVTEIDENGKYRNSNSIASCLRNARGDLKISPKDFRTTGASVLGTHEQFKFYALHWLADSPKGTANKNYVLPSQAEFDLSMKWLGKVFGQD